MAKNGLTRKQVEHVAKLAKLSIPSNELSVFGGQLSEITEYVSKISNVKVQMPKKVQISKPKTNASREDKTNAERCLTQEEAVSGAKNKQKGLFVVPAIFES
ncbi:MAG: Asp-tRNA(Asn)/Glu-tRNA(Gln) amidotransferase subunit GatC [Candidatus Blackburnbacteria bacterium]|nr:Asp-tRNA(Asn)/Glu-tRNA(Gln) amidotransferase subunit GatC [Candidatus Blackburnbacteria bacterium]